MASYKDSLGQAELNGFHEMPDDPVYEALRGEVLNGGTMLGAKIEVPKVFHPKQPRKLIHVAVYNHEDGQTAMYSFNYNKLNKNN